MTVELLIEINPYVWTVVHSMNMEIDKQLPLISNFDLANLLEPFISQQGVIIDSELFKRFMEAKGPASVIFSRFIPAGIIKNNPDQVYKIQVIADTINEEDAFIRLAKLKLTESNAYRSFVTDITNRESIPGLFDTKIVNGVNCRRNKVAYIGGNYIAMDACNDFMAINNVPLNYYTMFIHKDDLKNTELHIACKELIVPHVIGKHGKRIIHSTNNLIAACELAGWDYNPLIRLVVDSIK